VHIRVQLNMLGHINPRDDAHYLRFTEHSNYS